MRISIVLIHRPLKIIKTLFNSKKIKERNYKTDKKEIALEIKFEHAHIVCLFDEYNICDVICIFLDNPKDMIFYHTYCANNYPFDESVNGWVHNDRCIQIHTEDEKKHSLLIVPMSLARNL